MKKLVLGLALATLTAFPAAAQQLPNLPQNTVYGRLGIGTGPGQAVPFSVLINALTAQNGVWTGLQTFTGSIAATSTAPPVGNGGFISAIYGPVTVGAAPFTPISISSFLQTSGDRGQTGYQGFFNQVQLSAGQGGNFYAGTDLAQVGGTWIPAASGISGVIGRQMGAVSNRGGYVFGANPYCQTLTVAAIQCIGMEIDTDNRINGTTDKVGLQVVDISTSNGTVSGINAGLLIGAQAGANLYNIGLGIQAGHGVFPIQSGGTAIQITGGTVAHGVDFTGLTCSTDCIRTPGFVVGPGGTIGTGLNGGTAGNVTLNGSTSGSSSVSANSVGQMVLSSAGGAIIINANGASPLLQLNGLTSGFASLKVSDTGGHLSYAGSGTPPTLTAGCNGAGSVVSGTDISGTVTGQTAAATTCTLTFGTAFGAAPNCVAMGQNSPLTGAATPGTGTLVVNFTSTANYKFSYLCAGT